MAWRIYSWAYDAFDLGMLDWVHDEFYLGLLNDKSYRADTGTTCKFIDNIGLDSIVDIAPIKGRMVDNVNGSSFVACDDAYFEKVKFGETIAGLLIFQPTKKLHRASGMNIAIADDSRTLSGFPFVSAGDPLTIHFSHNGVKQGLFYLP